MVATPEGHSSDREGPQKTFEGTERFSTFFWVVVNGCTPVYKSINL